MENKRRSFLKKSALVTLGSVVAAKGLSAMNEDKEKKTIKRVRALGFQWETLDPFLFCVHHEDFFPEGNENMGPDVNLLKGRNIGSDFHIKDGWRMYHGKQVPGFPGHPHRGFETITVVRKGMVDHSDSLGAAGRYGDGDVQWMTAGKEIQHAEMFPLINKDKPNNLELFQIWLNLPKKSKMVEPHFKMLWNEGIPKFIQDDENGNKAYVEVITGVLGEHAPTTPPPNSWAADNNNEVAVWNIKIEKGGTFYLPAASAGLNRSLYFYEGKKLGLNGSNIDYYHAVDVESDHILKLEAIDESASILVLQGKPINEPVVQHGPFVMNSRQEIQQAFEDYQKTQFGGWPWSTYGPVHDRSKGRFAKHADGKEEVKS